jgi:hypothetical protein
MFLRIFDLQDARSCLRWEHTARPAGARWNPPREPGAAAHTKRAKKQCLRAAAAPADARARPPVPTEAGDDFVHVACAQEDDMHDFELV